MSRRESDLRRASAQRKESIGRLNQRQVSISDPPPVPTVTVAVLAPRLPSCAVAAPRTGVAAADVFNWDEALNWRSPPPPPPADDPERPAQPRRNSRNNNGLSFKKVLPLPTTRRTKANPDLPPFVMRQVPYETWRRHYAKDKDGNYKGTHAPAEDCLLRPHDVERWKFKGEGGEGVEGDPFESRFTRGKEALPVYHEVKEEGLVPGYEADYDPDLQIAGNKDGHEDARNDYDRPPAEEPILDEDEGARRGDRQQQQQAPPPPPPPPPPTPLEQGLARDSNSGLLYDAQREREELVARNKGVKGWKSAFKRGLEMAGTGGGTG